MEAEARYARVGAVMLALLAALLLGIVWLTNLGGRDQQQRFAINFEAQALDGLEVGSPVRLRGIKVGRVEAYALSEDQLRQVRVEVQMDRPLAVPDNAVAVINRNLVTGIAAIDLVLREPLGPPLPLAEPGEDLPLIAEGLSDIDEIAARVTRVGDLAAQTLGNLSNLTSPANSAQLIHTVNRIGALAGGLETRLEALEQALERTSQAAGSIARSAQTLGQAGQRMATAAESTGASVSALADQTTQQVDSLSAQAATTLQQAGTALTQTQQTLAGARDTLAQVQASVLRLEAQAGAATQRLEFTAEQMEDQLTAASTELRASLEATQRVLDRLRDPRAALIGPTAAQRGPGEAQP